jgi:UDP-N-acetylmuramate dehydrogenase
MVTIEENVSLLPFNSFAIDASARRFCRISNVEELQELVRSPFLRNTPHLILGEGTNMLFTKDFDGLVIKIEIKGIEIVAEDESKVTIKVGAGESWHGLVLYCVSREWGGLENLSLIPGTVGAAPIQNIGAYGVEVKEMIENVTGVDSSNGDLRTFSRDECLFEYRESAFKHDLKEKYFISSVTLSLTKKNHFFTTSYGAIQDTLIQQNGKDFTTITVKAISDAVISIRQHKLPDTSILGSAGSFFKNPSVSTAQYELIKKEHPQIPSYPSVNHNVKLPAGWLIEQCGWKGKRIENIGVHQHQALVLVNYGGGRGEEIFQLAMKIKASVFDKFGVMLETEVNII